MGCWYMTFTLKSTHKPVKDYYIHGKNETWYRNKCKSCYIKGIKRYPTLQAQIKHVHTIPINNCVTTV